MNAYEASRSRPVSRVGGLSRMIGRPPRYALTCRYGRPGKPTSQSEAGRSPAKRCLDTIVTSPSDALNIWLAFKRTRFNVCAFCMAARTVAVLIMSGAFFFEQGLPLPPRLAGGWAVENERDAFRATRSKSLRHAPRESISPKDRLVLLKSLSYEVLYKSVI